MMRLQGRTLGEAPRDSGRPISVLGGVEGVSRALLLLERAHARRRPPGCAKGTSPKPMGSNTPARNHVSDKRQTTAV